MVPADDGTEGQEWMVWRFWGEPELRGGGHLVGFF